MSSVNKVIILGRLGKDPEIKTTTTGKTVCTFTVATSDPFSKETEWHRIVLWEKLATLAGQYLSKGRKVYIEGKLQTRSWNDKSGNKQSITEIIGSNIVFVDSSKEKQPEEPSIDYQQETPAASKNTIDPTMWGDDIPF